MDSTWTLSNICVVIFILFTCGETKKLKSATSTTDAPRAPRNRQVLVAKSCISGSRNEGLLSLRCPESWSIHIQQAHLMSDCDSDLACCVKGSYTVPVDDFPGTEYHLGNLTNQCSLKSSCKASVFGIANLPIRRHCLFFPYCERIRYYCTYNEPETTGLYQTTTLIIIIAGGAALLIIGFLIGVICLLRKKKSPVKTPDRSRGELPKIPEGKTMEYPMTSYRISAEVSQISHIENTQLRDIDVQRREREPLPPSESRDKQPLPHPGILGREKQPLPQPLSLDKQPLPPLDMLIDQGKSEPAMPADAEDVYERIIDESLLDSNSPTRDHTYPPYYVSPGPPASPQYYTVYEQ